MDERHEPTQQRQRVQVDRDGAVTEAQVHMTLKVQGFNYDDPSFGHAAPIYYAVRRQENGRWEVKMTDDSQRQELHRIQSLKESSIATINEDRAAELEILLKSAVWIALEAEFVGSLEVQYQRFLRHYREG